MKSGGRQVRRLSKVLDRLPPHAPEAERCLLGSMIVEPERIEEIAGLVDAADFYVGVNAIVFRHIVAIRREREAFDLVLLADRLRKAGVFETVLKAGAGTDYLAQLAAEVPNAANALHYAALVQEAAERRRIIGDVSEVLASAHDESIDALRARLHALRGPAPTGERSERAGAVLVRLSDVQPESVDWLWPERIPLGMLTLLTGDPGCGKSMLTIDLAARVTRGTPWPDAPDVPQPTGGVVLLTAEDPLDKVVRPRLDAAGADVTRVTALPAVMRRPPFDPERDQPPEPVESMLDLGRDLDAVEAAIDATPGCRLVVIDPVSAYMGETDDHRNAELRGLLAPLAALAERRGIAVVAVSHLRKSPARAIHRTLGSVAYVAAARAAWLVARDPEQKSRRLLLPVKSNLAAEVTGLAYGIAPVGIDGAPAVAWEPNPVELDADAVLGATESAAQGAGGEDHQSAVEEAAEWLQEELADGPRPSRTVESDAEACTIRGGTLRRAKARVGVEAFRPRGRRDGPWYWRLPGDTREPVEGDGWSAARMVAEHLSADPRTVASIREEVEAGGTGLSWRRAEDLLIIAEERALAFRWRMPGGRAAYATAPQPEGDADPETCPGEGAQGAGEPGEGAQGEGAQPRARDGCAPSVLDSARADLPRSGAASGTEGAQGPMLEQLEHLRGDGHPSPNLNGLSSEDLDALDGFPPADLERVAAMRRAFGDGQLTVKEPRGGAS